MKRSYLFQIFVVVLGFISCKKEDKNPNPSDKYFNPGPPVYTADYIQGQVNGGMILANYKYNNDTTYNSFSSSNKLFHFLRFDHSAQHFWAILGSNIDLTSLTYPKSYNSIPNSGNEKVIISYKSPSGKLFTQSIFDSTLFTIELLSFVNDTLTGNFNGKLIEVDHDNNADTIINVINGSFKGHLINY